jgi:hypothetical protein
MAIPNFISNSLSVAPVARTNQIVNGNPAFNGLRVGPEPERVISGEIKAAQGVDFLAYPSDLPKYYFGMVEMSVTGAINIGAGFRGLKPERGYRLPLPLHLQDAHSVQYDHSYNWLNLLNSLTLNLSSTVTNAAGAAFGFAVNQIKQVTIQSPEFRSFAFDWKLSPRNLSDSARIREIYFNIKKGMLPAGSEAGPDNAVFVFPRVYQCYFAPNPEWLFNFKPAVITAIQIDYNGGNPQPAFYKQTGAPESIILRLSFLELDYWISQDVTLDYEPLGRSNVGGSQSPEEQARQRILDKKMTAEEFKQQFPNSPYNRFLQQGAK